jgi:hypothetical protein
MEIVSRTLPDMGPVLGNEPKKVKTPPHLFPLPMLASFVATRGSGKTVAMTTLLKKYQAAGLCQRVFLITETYASNEHLFEGLVEPDDVFSASDPDALEKIMEALTEESSAWKRYKSDWELYKRAQKQMNQYAKARIPSVDVYMLGEAEGKGLHEHPPQYRYGNNIQHPQFFLVVDDAQGTVTFRETTKKKVSLTNLCIRHRHVADRLGVSILIAVQSYKSQSGNLSRSLRSNCTLSCIWGLKDSKMIAEISAELGREITQEVFEALYAYATSGSPHDFLTIHFSGPRQFRKNWSEVLEVRAR